MEIRNIETVYQYNLVNSTMIPLNIRRNRTRIYFFQSKNDNLLMLFILAIFLPLLECRRNRGIEFLTRALSIVQKSWTRRCKHCYTLKRTIDDPVLNLVGIEARLEDDDDLGSLGEVDVDACSDTAPPIFILEEDGFVLDD